MTLLRVGCFVQRGARDFFAGNGLSLPGGELDNG
jgi:hypothetical protein